MSESRERKSADDTIERARKYSEQEKQRLEKELKKITEKERTRGANTDKG